MSQSSEKPVNTITHTPGPWSLSGTTIDAPSESSIAIAYGFDVNGRIKDTPETFANARLISAAPELLEALQTANAELAALVPHPDDVQRGDWPEELNGADRECLHTAFRVIRAAIAKATAQPPAGASK